MRPSSALLVGFVKLMVGAYARWIGTGPTSAQRIYFANHTSHIDTLALWSALPRPLRARTRPIAARDYWTAGRFKHWITREVFNAVFVSRQRTDDEDPLDPLVEALANGDSLVIFPEGTRSSKGEPQPFKSGLYHLAERFPAVQLIPAWIDNVQRVMPKGEVVPVPILCTVTFGPPMALAPGEEKRAFLERARAAVIAQRPRVA